METFFDSERVVARWSKHFQKLLNLPGDIDHEALDNNRHRLYSWEDRAMTATEVVWLPREVHSNDRDTTYWNDGEC